MKRIISLIFCFSLPVFGIEVDYSAIESIVAKHSNLIDGLKQNKQRKLVRFDLQLGISAEGGVGVLTAGGGAATEFIWLKSKDSDDDLEENGSIASALINPDERQIYQSLKRRLVAFGKENRIKPRFIRRTLRKVKKDAGELSRLAHSLSTIPSIGGWYIDGFFRSYNLGVDFKIPGIVGVGSEKRLRLRFKVAPSPLAPVDPENYNSRQRRVTRLMTNLAKLSAARDIAANWQLTRVRSIHELGVGLDFAVFSVSGSKAVTLEFKRKIESPGLLGDLGPVWSSVRTINHSLIDQLEWRDLSLRDDLELAQTRVKFAVGGDLDFQLVTIEREASIEFHYMRGVAL